MAVCMTGFQNVGTAKSVCLCVFSVSIWCVCVCLLWCLCHCWLHTDGWCLSAWVSLSHITHVCRPTWLQCADALKMDRGGGGGEAEGGCDSLRLNSCCCDSKRGQQLNQETVWPKTLKPIWDFQKEKAALAAQFCLRYVKPRATRLRSSQIMLF